MASRSATRPRNTITAGQARVDELKALGLKANATAAQINAALTKHYPSGLPTSDTDPKTGLPYTQATAKAAGSGNIVGNILGALTGGAAADLLLGGAGAAGAIDSADAGAADTATTAATGATASGGATSAATGAAAGGAKGLVSAAITSPLDFLMFIAWIFHPRTLLRAVEFLSGIALMAFGLWVQIRGGSGTPSVFGRAGGAILEGTAAGRATGGAFRGRRSRSEGRQSARQDRRNREHQTAYRFGRQKEQARTGKKTLKQSARKDKRRGEKPPF